MREIVARQLEDVSTRDAFCFSVRCAECGGAWRSRKTAFSKAGTTPASEGKRIVFGALYQKERERARNAAIREAIENFNCCPHLWAARLQPLLPDLRGPGYVRSLRCAVKRAWRTGLASFG